MEQCLEGINSMRQFWAIGFVLSCLVLPSLSYSDQSYSDESKMAEYQMKALFLYNFANFVDWPNGAFKSRSEKITMCLYGRRFFASNSTRKVRVYP